jgi:hypothetical protein
VFRFVNRNDLLLACSCSKLSMFPLGRKFPDSRAFSRHTEQDLSKSDFSLAVSIVTKDDLMRHILKVGLRSHYDLHVDFWRTPFAGLSIVHSWEDTLYNPVQAFGFSMSYFELSSLKNLRIIDYYLFLIFCSVPKPFSCGGFHRRTAPDHHI